MHFKHYSLLLFAGITYFTTALAQPRIKDQGVIGGNAEEDFLALYLTNDGGLIAGGLSYSNISGEKTENRKGLTDYWIVKLDSNHIIQWDKTVGGSDLDVLQAVQQTADGGYITGGYSYSNISGDKTENGRGDHDYWVVKLDAAGNIQWDKTIGGTGNDPLFALQQTTDGGYILGGWSDSNISGEKTENSRGNSDYWIVKLDGSGNIEWDKTIGGAGFDELYSLQQTADGGYILGGSSSSGISGEKTANSRGNSDYWIVKLDGSGHIEWDKTIGGSNYDALRAIRQTADGGYILGGYSNSKISHQKTDSSRGLMDYWIVKLRADGTIQWNKTIGGSDYDALTSVQQTMDGGYMLGGYSNSGKSGEKTENSRGGFDYWVVKTNSYGKVQWDKTIGGSFDEGGVDKVIAREIKRNYYVVGGSSSSPISGDKTGGSRGQSINSDYWLVELRYLKPDSTAIAQIPNSNKLKAPLQNNLLPAFPNPATDKLTIQSSGKATFTLTNQQGKVMLTKVIENTGTIDVSTIPSGVYYLINTNTRATQKIVVNK